MGFGFRWWRLTLPHININKVFASPPALFLFAKFLFMVDFEALTIK